ncbi:MAG: VWA domain-containing protein [Verrucomicrobiota bacterium]|nr:VWA domain-containing protein [Verrucomicrobiota bacterium]
MFPTFAQPIWLYTALPIALLVMVVGLFWAETRRKKKLARFIDHGPLASKLVQAGGARRWWAYALRITAVTLLFVALARPQWGFEYKEVKAKGIDILIALDVSRSMLAEDVKPNRLQRAKLAIHDLLEKLQGDRVGLITFAGDAFTQCPLTLDYDAFSQTVDSLDTSTIGRPGTNIAAAIGEAEQTFSSKDNHRLLILITDGEDLEARGIQKAREAAAGGMKIFTVGVGSANGELILVPEEQGGRSIMKGADGKPVRTRLDEAALRTIAESTNGFYINLSQTGGLSRILDDGLADIPREEREAKLQRQPIERFQWPLALAFAFFCLEIAVESLRRAPRRAGLVVAILAAGFAFTTPSVEAASPRQAQSLFEKEDFPGSVQAYKELLKDKSNPKYEYNLGVSQLRAGSIDDAENSFRDLLGTKDITIQADAYYNLSAILYKKALALHEQEKADDAQKLYKESFKALYKSLQLRSDDTTQALFNQLIHEYFANRCSISVKATPPEGGTVAINNAATADHYLKGSSLNLKATPAPGYQFVEWTGGTVADAKQAETTLTVEQHTALIASFVRVYKLTVEVDDPLSGAAGNTGDYPENSQTPVGAEPNEGFTFNRWEGDGLTDKAAVQTTVLMDKDKTIKAYFDRHALLAVVPNSRQAGKTTGTCDPYHGQEVPITATPNQGFLFDHWEGQGIIDPDKPETAVFASGDTQTIIAVFRPEKNDKDEKKDQDKKDEEKKDQQKQDQKDKSDSKDEHQKEDSKSSEKKDGKDEKSAEEKQAEQQKAEQQEKEKKEAEKKAQAGDKEKSEEEKQQAEEAKAADEAQQKAEDQERRAAGVMTRQEAVRLLEASRSKEKKLPLYVPSEDNKDTSTEGRDW